MPDNHEETRPKPTRPVVPPETTLNQPTVAHLTPPSGLRPVPPPPAPDPRYAYAAPADDIPAPPRLLFWAVIGLFVLGVLGVFGVVLGFRFVLEPSQQQRVMDQLPFMEAFLPPRPGADARLPTPESAALDDLSPDDLLSDLLGERTPTAEADNPTEAASSATSDATPTPAVTATVAMTPTPQSTETPIATLAPTSAPTQSPSVAPTVEAAAIQAAAPPRPASARLTGFVHQQQTWNNCGPANITMALSYYGWRNDQAYAMNYLRPGGREDRNVNPWELVSFVNTQSSVRALTRMGGTLELLKQFLANEIPVVIETGFMPEGYDWLGHYRTLVAYDDSLGVFWAYDSFLGDGENGEGVALDYTGIDRDWKQFNRQFIVVYEPAREALVQTILGEYADTRRAAEIARDTALAEAQANPSDADAWFNVGSSLVALGDYERAANAYDLALREGLHWRTTFYQFGIYEAYYQTGRYAELLSLVDSSLSSGGVWVEETYYWQGRALAAQGRTADARTAFGMALNRNPSYQAARDARDALDS